MLPISTFIKKSLALEVQFNEDRNLQEQKIIYYRLKVNSIFPVVGFKKVTSGLKMHFAARKVNE